MISKSFPIQNEEKIFEAEACLEDILWKEDSVQIKGKEYGIQLFFFRLKT
jgi:hypothetical protein